MAILDCKAAWKAIETYRPKRLSELFDADRERVRQFSRDVASIHFDWSKTHLDEELLGAFAGLAYMADYHGARDCLFAGDIVNFSENRPATHVAERGQGKPEDNRLAAERHARMRSLIDAIEGGAFGEIDSILHIGIGGSALGPDLVIDALGRDADRFEVRVLANIDGEAFDEATWGLDPASTLVVAVSKTFTTTETLTNLDAALEWLREAGVSDPYGQVDRGHRRARTRRSLTASTKRASCRSARALAGAIRCGPRSACRSHWRLAGVRSRNCSKALRKWTAM